MGMTGVGDDSRGRRFGRPWLVVGFTLAVGATLALVLSNDLRWLRLGIIAALWAAVIGAFLAVKYRKHAAHSDDAVAEAQAVYELELEREIAARREFELELEAEAKERADEDSRDELDALRAEVVALRESLQSLFGGEVFYERIALTAQATRMRSIKDDRLVSGAEGNGKPVPAQLVAGKGKKTVDVVDRPTELIERVLEQAPTAEKRRTVNPIQSAPVRPKPLEEPIRRVSQGDGAATAARAAESAGEATRRPQPAPVQSKSRPVAQPKTVPPKPAQPTPGQQTERSRPALAPVERRPRVEPGFTRSAMDGSERGRPAGSVAPPAPKPKPVEPPALPVERTAVVNSDERVTELHRDWNPSWAYETPSERSVTNLSAAFPSRRNIPPASSPAKDVEDAAAARRGSHRSTDEQPAPMRNPARSESNPTLHESVREVQQQPSSGGRRRRADDEPSYSVPTSTPEQEPVPSEPERPVSGGRRRRPDGEPPPWEGLAEPEPVNGSRHSSNGSHPPNGSHSKPSMEPAAHNGSNGRRSAASHTAGRSVNDLLAAHGAADSTPRRRRRAED